MIENCLLLWPALPDPTQTSIAKAFTDRLASRATEQRTQYAAIPSQTWANVRCDALCMHPWIATSYRILTHPFFMSCLAVPASFRIERPSLRHFKSGRDRTGGASPTASSRYCHVGG